jgi:hypothetical protein
VNVKLTEVVSDITGATGMAILRAILHGERDPLRLAKLRNRNCRRTEAEIARALQGNWRDEHLFALQQALALYDFYQGQVRECDDRLQAQLATFACAPCRPGRRSGATDATPPDTTSVCPRSVSGWPSG